jgi:putative DNA primase/helicase
LIENLCGDDEKAWATYNRGNPIAPRQVARKLKEYGIASKTIRTGYDTAKGFEADQFREAFARYLSPPSENAVLSVTASQASSGNGYSVTDYPQRYASQKLSGTLQALPIQGCDAVTDKSPENQKEESIEVSI